MSVPLGSEHDLLEGLALESAQLAPGPLEEWVELIMKAAVFIEDVVPEEERPGPGNEGPSLVYSLARNGFAARGVECERYGAAERNERLAELLDVKFANGNEEWLDAVCAATLDMIDASAKHPEEPIVVAVLAPAGIGHPARRRLAEMVTAQILFDEHGEPRDRAPIRVPSFVRSWLFGYYLSACAASLPQGAVAALAAVRVPA